MARTDNNENFPGGAKPGKDEKVRRHKDDAIPAPNPPLICSHGLGWEKMQLIWHRQPPSFIPEHFSQHLCVCINTGNEVTLEKKVDGQSQTFDALPTGDIGLYPAFTKQFFHSHSDSECCLLFLESSLLDEVGGQLNPNNRPVFETLLGAHFDPVLYHMGLALKAVISTSGTSSKLYADTMAQALAIHLLANYAHQPICIDGSAKKLSEIQLKRVIDYIHCHYDQEISLSALADIAHLSPYHFARLFKMSTGLAPHQYHLHYRLERARHLLLQNKLNIAQIANVVGFSNQSHLNYHFKRWLGVSPSSLSRKQ